MHAGSLSLRTHDDHVVCVAWGPGDVGGISFIMVLMRVPGSSGHISRRHSYLQGMMSRSSTTFQQESGNIFYLSSQIPMSLLSGTPCRMSPRSPGIAKVLTGSFTRQQWSLFRDPSRILCGV